MIAIPEGEEHDEYYDLFEHTPDGWLCYNGHNEWGKMSERKLSKDVRDGVRRAPEPISQEQVDALLAIADLD